MNAVASSVRGAIVQSYLDRHEPLPAWIAQPVIWHLGLLRHLQIERGKLKIPRRRRHGTRR